MKKISLLLLVAVMAFTPAHNIDYTRAELARWQQQADGITIIRDDWGIAHVYGKTDADAVFGAMYAQAEDDFNRIEVNYMTNLGRTAIAEGESAIWMDLRAKLFINDDSLKLMYNGAPASLKALMDAWANGLNFYLAKNPQVHPKSIQKFEPWMALSFTEGSIGGDYEKVNLGGLQTFYGKETPAPPAPTEEEDLGFPPDPGGSNGFAISPKNTTGNRALLLINPHTSFFFRSELQMVSDEGLNVYGASTWGQFFIYQGFNEKAGWMHTSTSADATDEFLETVTKNGSHYTYKHGNEQLPVREVVVTIPYKTATGMAERKFTVFYTKHGPITHEVGGKWVAFAAMNDPVKALTQSYTRTKAHNLDEYKKNFDLHTNSSNNTLFADASGNIAYFHANYLPVRDTKFDWRQPVDGSDPATDYKGLLSFDKSPNVINPASGWVFNTNNSPWTAAGPSSLKKENYAPWVDYGSESARSAHAIRVLENRKDFTIDRLRLAAYDSYQTYFERPIPALVAAYDAAPASALKSKIADQIALLRKWDLRWGVTSVETTVAIYWAEDLQRSNNRGGRGGARGGRSGGNASAPDSTVIRANMLQSLANASDKLTTDFGSWRTPWGEVNRFQRITDDIVQPFTDAGPSIPVGFSSATWGSLASFATRTPPGMKKRYGQSGNSFVAVVEFGDSVRAVAVTAGGESGDPKSKHFDDQAERYATGNLRNVYFYKSQLKGHTEREYHPGK